jgi:hypothetical protein
MITRTNLAGAEDSILVRFNSDSGNNYAWHFLFGNGSNVFSAAGSSTSSIYPFAVVGNTQASGTFGVHMIDILDFSSTNKNKTLRSLTGFAGGTNRIALASGFWNNTNSINNITITPSGSSFLTGSRFSVYGVTA